MQTRAFAIRIVPAVASGIIASVLATPAFAAVYGGGGLLSGLQEASGLGGILGATSITQLILLIIRFLLNIVLTLAVLAIIVAGIYLIVSNGDDGSKEKAKNIIFYCIAGIILILFSRFIVVTVNHIFGDPSGGSGGSGLPFGTVVAP